MHVVYVCSPDRGNQLFVSLRSLFVSGTSFERVTIYCVGSCPSSWRFGDDRIMVEEVPDIGEGFWMTNKIHLCRAKGSKLVFLDTDTLVMEPLDSLLGDTSGDVVGGLSTYVNLPFWSSKLWEETLRQYGAQTGFPYLNTGVLVFKNEAHRRIGDSWLTITRKLRNEGLTLPNSRMRANQVAFSLACGVEGLSNGLLTYPKLVQGWLREAFDNAIVIHTGDSKFFAYAYKIARGRDILRANLPIPIPSVRSQYYVELFRYPLQMARVYFRFYVLYFRHLQSGRNKHRGH